MIKELVYRNRSCRRFQEQRRLTKEDLLGLVDLARCTASHRNAQELRFCLVWEKEQCDKVFPLMVFASALGPEGQPREGQRPAAYIAVLGESKSMNYLWADAGLACQSILLGAAEQGILGCIFGSVKREQIRPVLGLTEADPPVLLVIALGFPDEDFVIEEGALEGSRDYWREGRTHHVPKLALSDIVLERKGE